MNPKNNSDDDQDEDFSLRTLHAACKGGNVDIAYHSDQSSYYYTVVAECDLCAGQEVRIASVRAITNTPIDDDQK